MGNLTGNAEKKSTKTCQNDKTTENAGTFRDKKDEAIQKEKNNKTTWGNKPESPGERRKIKEILTKDKTIQTKRYIPKQRKKIFTSNWVEMTRKHTNNRMQEETNEFWLKYGNRKT